MFLAFRWLLRLFLVLAGLLLLATVGFTYFFSRSLPDYNARYELAGITAPVEIVRNNDAVPHIFGKNDPDVFFGLGFVHAQDRLWQMTMLRRTAQGRLSELFGERTFAIDEMMRRLDLTGLAKQSLAVQDPDTLAALQAYSAGVNQWIETVNAQAKGRGAPEFFLFDNEVAYWEPTDSLEILKLMAVQMSDHLQSEVLRARMSLLIPEARLRDILPDDPQSAVAALPPYAALFPNAPNPASKLALHGADPLSPFAPHGFSGASNAFAAAPERSAARGSLLANDPHLGFSAPSIWYLARIELQSGGVIGGTIPGIPAVLVGRSSALGWGLTSAHLDDQDLLLEQVNPDNPAQYRTPSGFKDFETRRSIVNVKDQSPRTLTLAWSDNGPILPASHANLGAITPPGHVASLSWTLMTGQDTTLSAVMRLMRAQSVPQAVAAGALFVAPALNLMLADETGIGMQLVGWVPRRDPLHQTQGRMPAPGWLAENRWLGIFPYAENLQILAPDGGILGNTNNKTTDAPFPNHLSFEWGDTQRIQRWQRLMQSREVHTLESFIEAQLDTVSNTARTVLPLVAADLWYGGDPAPKGTPERLRQRALALLADWNGEMNEHLPEPLIYAAWMRQLQQRLIRDELGPMADEFTQVDPVFLSRVFRNLDGAGVWCDILQSAPVESCVDIARLSLDAALLELSEQLGGAPESWRWGDQHQAAHDHPVLGQTGLLRHLVNIRQSTSGGDDTLQRGLTSGKGDAPYTNVHGAGYRGVYDFADPDSSVFVISTGQSGHPLSRHYDDLGEIWRRGDYVPMSLDPDLARAGALGVIELTPASR